MREKMKDAAWLVAAAFMLGSMMTMAIDAWLAEMEREAAISECMQSQSDCEYLRCASMVDGEPMSEEHARVCY